LDPPKPPELLALQQRFDAIDKIDDLFAGFGLLHVEIDPDAVGPRAELLIFGRGHHHHSQSGEFAPHDDQHLKAVHLRHAQIDQQQVEGFTFQQRQGSRSVVGDVDFGLARQARQNLLVNFQDVLFVVENENFLAGSHNEPRASAKP
jgi:hypothetical protein